MSLIKKINILIVILITTCSCEYSNNYTLERTLMRGTWSYNSWDKYYYSGDKFDSIHSVDFEFNRSFYFETDGIMYCNDIIEDTLIVGEWKLDSTNTRLYTRIGIQLSVATGYGFQYFFHPNCIVKEFESRTIFLETPVSKYYIGSGTEQRLNKTYEKITLKRD